MSQPTEGKQQAQQFAMNPEPQVEQEERKMSVNCLLNKSEPSISNINILRTSTGMLYLPTTSLLSSPTFAPTEIRRSHGDISFVVDKDTKLDRSSFDDQFSEFSMYSTSPVRTVTQCKPRHKSPVLYLKLFRRMFIGSRFAFKFS